ncbi:MAG: S41 family peptidase [Actinobacteria bacterium]|nr:S41 family peptidase [Actinomycetota bacterium]
MARLLKSTIVVVVVWALLALLVAAGVVLGSHAVSRNVLRTALPASVAEVLLGPEDSFPLQEEVLDQLRSSFYRPIETDELIDDSIKGMLSGLEDDYTNYLDPEQYEGFKERTNGSYSGVGMTVEMLNGYVTVVSTFKDTPAAKAGLGSGDIILAVDGVDTEGQDLDEVVSRIKGEEGTEVTLKVYHVPPGSRSPADEAGVEPHLPEGGTTEELVLVRRSIVVPVLESETLTSGGRKIEHIRFVTFSEDSAQRLRDAVKRAVEENGASAIILDLRHNGGGLLNEAVDVASIFVPEGVIVTTEGLHSPRQEYEARGGAISTDVPLFVLIDGFSASASEIVAGAVKDTGRGTLVGETTFGKGLVQTILSLSDGSALKVTTAVYFTPAGVDINNQGIAPDVVAPDDPVTEDVDEALEKALSLAGQR